MSKISADLKTFFDHKYPRFWKLKLEYFPIKKVFPKTANNKKISQIKLIMSKISADLKNLFCAQNPRFWNLKSDFFPIKKVFRRFSKIGYFFLPELDFYKKKKSENIFREGGREGGKEVGR